MEIKPAWVFGEQGQEMELYDKVWAVDRAIKVADEINLPVHRIRPELINLHELEGFPSHSFIESVSHIKQVLDADIRHPILLDEMGGVIDGRHRIAAALLWDSEISYRQFESDPPECFTWIDDTDETE